MCYYYNVKCNVEMYKPTKTRVEREKERRVAQYHDDDMSFQRSKTISKREREREDACNKQQTKRTHSVTLREKLEE